MEAGEHGSTEELIGGLFIFSGMSWGYVFKGGGRHHCGNQDYKCTEYEGERFGKTDRSKPGG